jgi:serine/threonine protein kinase
LESRKVIYQFRVLLNYITYHLLNLFGFKSLFPTISIIEMLDNSNGAESFVGTIAYMSPARIKGAPYSYEADMWGLGMSIIAFTTGKTPFPTNRGYWQLMNAILHGPEPTLQQLDPGTAHSPELVDFIHKCLDAPIGDKHFASKLLNHPFLIAARERGILNSDSADPPMLLQHRSLLDDTTEGSMNNIVETTISWQLERLADESFKRSRSKDGDLKTLNHSKLPEFSSSQIQWLASQMVIESDILEKK